MSSILQTPAHGSGSIVNYLKKTEESNPSLPKQKQRHSHNPLVAGRWVAAQPRFRKAEV